nr:hypothetical protein [Tanacetum cinerariifolium]
MEAPIVVECVEDPFEELDDILCDYAHTRKQITGNEITRKQMVVHVGNSSTADDVLELEMLFETEGVGPVGKLKKVKVDADNKLEEESDTEGDYTSGSDSDDLDYDPKHDEVFADDEHIVEDVHVSMNNFRFTADPKHDISIGVVEGLIQAIASVFPSAEHREYLMKRIVVVHKVIAKTVGPLIPSVTKLFDAIKKRLLSTLFNGMEAHVYSIKVNPCNGREMWPVVEATTVIVPPLYKPQAGRPPNERKKSHDEIANESFSSGKLSRKGKSVRCGKCGNVGHNRKGCKGQGGATQGGFSARNVSSQGGARRIVGARNVSGQASARQAAGVRTVSGQAGCASNVSSQSGGSSQPIAAQSTSTGARNASSQPSAAPSTASQGPTQHSVGPRQGFQAPRSGFPTQRLTKAIASIHNPRKFSS